MEALKTVPYLFLILAVAGIIAGASLLTVSKFRATMEDCTNTSLVYNRTMGGCVNISNPTLSDAAWGNMTDEYKSTLQVEQGMTTVSEQFPTIGIIAVMVIIISLIAGVFVYFAYFK